MNKSLNILACMLMITATLSACVTINIYFPAAAAEKAADKIIDDVWQLKDGVQVPVSKPTATEPATSTPATSTK